MCGIGGVVALGDGELPDAEFVASSLIADLHHRGPDGNGVWQDDHAVLAHTRLAIIDLEGSEQPMRDDEGRVLVYNGEVFNYRQLRRDLPGSWRTLGDTEVFMRLLAERGPEGLRDVRGQFAAALWDPRRCRLTLVRDEVGVLPLFWWTDGRRLAFSSDVDALRAIVPGPVGVDPEGVALYLRYRAVPAPGTLWSGIRKLRPGHAVIFEEGATPREEPWAAPAPDADDSIGVQEATRTTRALLEQAVERALEADVPVGLYLSGGLDSSLVCALAGRQRGTDPVHTFCATFTDSADSEGRWAAQVAAHLGTRHVEVPIVASDFADEWPALSRARGAPVSEPADMAMHHLARRARQDVKVVLSGEGSDELFAGYPKYRFARLTREVRRVPELIRRVGPDVAEWIPPKGRRAAVALRALGQRSEDDRVRAWFASFTAAEVAALTGGTPVREPVVPAAAAPPLVRMLRYDQGPWLSDNLLERGDRMSMAASLELRPPFLDADVVAYARTLPPSVLLHGGSTKSVVKQVAADVLPPSIVERRKAGFPVPIGQWLRTGLRDFAHDALTGGDAFIADHLDRRAVQILLRRHDTGRAEEAIRIWTLLSLEVWGRHTRSPRRGLTRNGVT